MNYQSEYHTIGGLINKANHVIIVPHVDPDPDALGSAYGLALAIMQMGKTCRIGLQEKLIRKYDFIIPDESVYTYTTDSEKPYDLFFALDIGSIKRVGQYIDLLNSGISCVNIDHHIDNEKFGDVAIVDDGFSSTSEMIFHLLTSLNVNINKDMALPIYTGIVYDTGSFRYSLTTKRTHQVVSALLDFDIDTNQVYESLFENMSEAALRLVNRVTGTLKTFCDGKVALTFLRNHFYEECGASESDALNLVKIGSSVRGVEFAIFMKEKDNTLTKVSLRSKGDFNVNEIASKYGGGGHKKASGFVLNRDFDKAMDEIVESIIPLYDNKLSVTKPLLP